MVLYVPDNNPFGLYDFDKYELGRGGAGTFLMEHMPKSTQRVGGCIS